MWSQILLNHLNSRVGFRWRIATREASLAVPAIQHWLLKIRGSHGYGLGHSCLFLCACEHLEYFPLGIQPCLCAMGPKWDFSYSLTVETLVELQAVRVSAIPYYQGACLALCNILGSGTSLEKHVTIYINYLPFSFWYPSLPPSLSPFLLSFLCSFLSFSISSFFFLFSHKI